MPDRVHLVLCRSCDDVYKVVDADYRRCECGNTSATLDGELIEVTDPLSKAVVIEIDWETIDRMAPGGVLLGEASKEDDQRIRWKR